MWNKAFFLIYMDVSKNRGTPKSSILIGFSLINHPFWGTPIFGNTYIKLVESEGTLLIKKVQTCHPADEHLELKKPIRSQKDLAKKSGRWPPNSDDFTHTHTWTLFPGYIINISQYSSHIHTTFDLIFGIEYSVPQGGKHPSMTLSGDAFLANSKLEYLSVEF